LRSQESEGKKTVRTNVPLDPSKMGRESSELQANLRKRIVGQDQAIREIVSIYQMYLTGMNAPGRPVGNLLFLGPTGSGKTRIVEATAESLVNNTRAVIKIDCPEFQHSHEIAKLIGSPPGYLGHRETSPFLSQEVLNQYHTSTMKLSFVLFDEIEKASDALWNLLLGILDKGRLTLGDNRQVDFSRSIIFMTSNLGSSEMSALMSPKLGFSANDAGRKSQAGTVDEAMSGKLERSSLGAVRRKFTPEFINRLDKIVTFHPLGSEQLQKLLDIELASVQERILTAAPNRCFVFQTTEKAKSFLLDQGIDMKYGARYLKRAIDRLLVQPMSNLMATAQVRRGDYVRVDLDASLRFLTFVKEAEAFPLHETAEWSDPPRMIPELALASGATAQTANKTTPLSSKR
jgi:ATP-dependent Clp protease ATP-binding subunit ClpB